MTSWEAQALPRYRNTLRQTRQKFSCRSAAGRYYNPGLVSLPDHPRVIRELRLLERRTSRVGRDVVDHGRSGSDDYINAVAGALRMLDRRFTLMDLPDDNEEPKPPQKWAHADAMQELMRHLQ
jgi:hypothetical protein